MVPRRRRRRDPRRVAGCHPAVIQRPRRDPGLVLPDARGQRAVGCPGLDALRPAPARGREPRLQGHPDACRSVGRMRCPGRPDLRVQDRGLVHRRLCRAGPAPRRRPRRRMAELSGLGRRGRRPLQGRRDRRVVAADERGRGQSRRRVRGLPAGRRSSRRADRLRHRHVRTGEVHRPGTSAQPRDDRRRAMRDVGSPVQGRPRDPGHRSVRVPRLHAEPGGPGRPMERPGPAHAAVRRAGQATVRR